MIAFILPVLLEQREVTAKSRVSVKSPAEFLSPLAPWLHRKDRLTKPVSAMAAAAVSFFLTSLAVAQTGNPTLYLAQLRAQDGITSSGSGTAALQLSADETSAVISFSYSNLTSAVTAMHVHGPADPGQSGGILFDIDTATVQPDGTYLWDLRTNGE